MIDFAAYVFYVNRHDLLQRAIDSFPDLLDELTVVNNSTGGLHGSGMKVFCPPVPLTYTQSMNWMLKDALDHNKDFIIHFHSDAACQNPNAVKELLDRIRVFRDEGRRWGCAWTFYDILWAINPKAVQDIGGWDTNFSSYFCDNDLRRRLELNQWECINTNIQGLSHEGSATINSDPELQFINSITFPLFRHYYVQKWGGEPGKERYIAPFNR